MYLKNSNAYRNPKHKVIIGTKTTRESLVSICSLWQKYFFWSLFFIQETSKLRCCFVHCPRLLISGFRVWSNWWAVMWYYTETLLRRIHWQSLRFQHRLSAVEDTVELFLTFSPAIYSASLPLVSPSFSRLVWSLWVVQPVIMALFHDSADRQPMTSCFTVDVCVCEGGEAESDTSGHCDTLSVLPTKFTLWVRSNCGYERGWAGNPTFCGFYLCSPL